MSKHHAPNKPCTPSHTPDQKLSYNVRLLILRIPYLHLYLQCTSTSAILSKMSKGAVASSCLQIFLSVRQEKPDRSKYAHQGSFRFHKGCYRVEVQSCALQCVWVAAREIADADQGLLEQPEKQKRAHTPTNYNY